MLVDPAKQTLEWVRAGHEPAIFYDPVTDDFIELQGSGMALGVNKSFKYEKNQKENFARGSIVVIATDGVWEARNEKGKMFGRAAVYDVIRKSSDKSAHEIMETMISKINGFLNASNPEDDLTLVVLKAL